MNKHTVFVAGKHFVLLSDDKSKYVQKLAAEVNEAINNIALENPTLDRRGAAILCALDYADDKHKESLRNKSLSENTRPLISQADRQSKQIKELNEKLAEKENEINKLRKELEDLKLSVKKPTTTDAYDPLKKSKSISDSQIKKQNKGYKPTRQYSLFDDEK